ncbi:hypothetical protein F5X68DRAFT_257900 [Plectosphaerella plurivora]|uniref:Uncharacterized protein n=1 Tax=Plectosphaerella plurivora TaxID=936078 RepID=A0A9P9AEK6_9PEZI|nr:hypothetical protein F5X68DRAFT_257900 [Plectosphaerella plurivora]
MFLHSGASLHGHEFSNRQPSGNHMHATQRLRSALANSPARSLTPTPTSSTERSTSPLPRRFSLQGTSTAPSRPDALKRRPVSEISPRKEQVVRFDEEPRILSLVEPPSDDDTFSDGFSDIASLDGTTHRRSKSRRTPKPASNFLLAYPAPGIRTKQRRFVQIRPRLLLQLQQLSADKRPKPTLDVLPSRLLTGTHILPRLARRCPELFKLRGHLGLDDLVVARSEDFDAPGEDLDVKNLHQRDLVAVISPVVARREGEKSSADLAEIVLADGAVWMASSFTNGGFEFRHIDANGITKTARWINKSTRQRASVGSITSDYKFTFSMIDPMSRRHPVMATLTPSNLEVLDYYTNPKPNYRRSTIRSFPVSEEDDYLPPSPEEKVPHPVDEATRTLISITSIWVSLRHGKGWPAPNPSLTASPTPASSESRVSNERRRSNTFPTALTPKPSPPTSLPQRARSTGAAYMQRRQARLGNDAVVNVNPALLESDDEQKAFDQMAATQKKPGIYRRLRNWGHRISTHAKKH